MAKGVVTVPEFQWLDGRCKTCHERVHSMPYDFALGHGHVYNKLTELEYQLTGTCGWCFDNNLMEV